MKTKISIIIFIMFFTLTSCSQVTISNTYYASNEETKTFDISIEINDSDVNLTVDDKTFEISNINSYSNELNEIQRTSSSNEEFISNINSKIINVLDNIGFNEEILYNRDQLSKDKNIMLTKRSELGELDTETLLITTTYFNSNNEFNAKNISLIFEILRLFEDFTKKYHLSVLFVNNSSDINNTIDKSIKDINNINILGIIDVQIENTLNKVNVLNLNSSSKLSTFIKDSIDYNSINFVNMLDVIDKDVFNNVVNRNIDFVRVVSETNASDITKCADFLIKIISDILNKPLTPSVSINDFIFTISLTLSNHNSIQTVLYKVNDGEYREILDDSVLEFTPNSDLYIKTVDLFGNESDEISFKLF